MNRCRGESLAVATRRQAGALLLLSQLWVAAAIAYAQEPAPQPAADNEAAETDDDAIEIPTRLLDRPPFDRVTLDAANDNAVLETVLLDLPARRVPDNLPQEGELNLRRLSEPSIPYAVSWSTVAKIELYEQMLLEEAERLVAAKDFAQAFEYLAFLRTNYPELPRLDELLETYLWREASETFAAGQRDEAWPILVALYQRNPEYPRLESAVQAVSDAMVSHALEDKNYEAARAVVDLLERDFPKLQLTNAARWRQRFATDAQEQLARARAAVAAQDYTAAREAAAFAAAILPSAREAQDLAQQIQATAPEIRVGVTQFALPDSTSRTASWAAARAANLIDPRLVVEVDFGAEGGLYASPYGKIVTSDSGLETTLSLTPQALHSGVTPDLVALDLVAAARQDDANPQEDFAAILKAVRTTDGRDVLLSWRRPPIRPEMFLQSPMRRLTRGRGEGLWFQSLPLADKSREARFERTGAQAEGAGRPRFVVERLYEDDDAALAALIAGEVDVVDRVPPWQLDRLRGARDIVVSAYRLPTVHVLVPNLKNSLLDMRDFRRALCYGIDREGIVRDMLLGGQAESGFRTISGPFPAGVGLNDPVGYAYNSDLSPRPYDPRLAALLANVARTTLAKREAEARKAAADAAKKPAASDKEKAASDSPKSKPQAAAVVEDVKPAPPTPMTLAHQADPLARLACQAIKLQLDQVGIPIKLVELPADKPDAKIEYDLLYVELAVWEPLYDARRLVGARGVAGHASALMEGALDELDRAENLKQAQVPLKEIHRIAHYDLPLIPLWQTVNAFAHRTQLEGVGETPLSLYQNVAAWRKSFR